MSESHGLWAVVPVKQFAHTKRRLMPLLAREECGAFARAMLADVLSALMHTHALAGAMVVTGDADAAAMARACGARVVADVENAGTTAAVTQAARHLAGAGRDGMLMVPADVPLITPTDIEMIVLAHHAAPSVTLVPASFDGGTNALACSPPEALACCFGDNSFQRHREAARAGGIAPQILQLEHVGHDLDRPDDLAAFLLRPSTTQSYAYLSAHGIAERLRCAHRAGCDEPHARYLPR